MKSLVLLGGGYGNMRLMKEILPSTLPSDYSITLIDRMPFHGLKTEFYALAAGTKPDKIFVFNFQKIKKLIQYTGKLLILI